MRTLAVGGGGASLSIAEAPPPWWRPPICASEELNQGRYRNSSDDGSVHQNANPKPGCQHPNVGEWRRGERCKGEEEDNRCTGDQFSGSR